MPRDDSPTIKLSDVSCFLPLLTPAVIVIAFMGFYRTFLFCNGPDAPCSIVATSVVRAAVTTTDDILVRTYVAKATWTLVVGVHALACLAALVVAIAVMNKSLSNYGSRTRASVIGVSIALAATVGLAVSVFFNNDTGSPGPQLLRATVGQVLPSIFIYVRSFDALSLTAVFALCCATCAILWSNQPMDEIELRRRLGLLQYVLFTSAALLVIGVLRLSTTLNWGASFVPADSEAGKFITPLVSGIVSALGAYYTFLIAGMYVPAVLVLRARANELVKTVKPAEPERWLSENGLTVSFAKWLPKVVAILAPLMAGPFIDILKQMVGS